MAYIYLNKETLQTAINSLVSYSNSHASEVEACRNVNSSHGDEAGVGWRLADGGTLSEKGKAVKSLADEIKVRLDEAVALNDSGISMTDGDLISYYLPDGADDTVDNVRAYNSQSVANGKSDATALEEAMGSRDGKAGDGRTVDEILEEMAKHQDVPAYGASFVNTYGVDDYVDLPARLQLHYTTTKVGGGQYDPDRFKTDTEALNRANGVLGHVLAAATQAGGAPEGYDSWSEALYSTVTQEGHRGRMSSLNALLAAPGAVYETATLTDLGDRFEDLPFHGDAASRTPGQISGLHDDRYGLFYNEGASLAGGSMDPMYGVMTAMGNNPEAASQYLTPDGSVGEDGFWVPGEKTEERWKLLTSRQWDSEVGLDAFTSAQAAVSSLRGSEDADQAASATWATARSIEYAVNDVSEDKYTETMKENLSVLAANSSQELVSTANGGSPSGLGLSGDEAEQKSTLTTLVYRVIDNENAAATIASAAAQRINENYPDVSNEIVLNDKYKRLGGVYGYLEGVGSLRQTDLAEEDAARSAAAKNAMGTGLSVLTTVAGNPLTGPVAPLAWNVGTTVVNPILIETLSPEQAAQVRGTSTPGRDALEAMAYADAVNSGVVPSEALSAEHAHDQYGKPYDWYDNGRVNLPEDLNAERTAEMHDWAGRVEDGGVFQDTDGAIDDGVNGGVARILGEDGAGGNRGPENARITIKGRDS